MKKKFKEISLLIVILLVTTFIYVKTSEASDVATQPNFTIQNLKATPDPAKVGEDILVTGQIVPQDFETTVQPKEIVLVLDTSGSMNEEITLDEECKEERIKYCSSHNSPESSDYHNRNHKWINDYCQVHKKSGKHYATSTKMNELKKAAKSFVETMKDVPNLKIGIVAYSTEATINPYEYNYGKRTIKSLDSSTSFEVQNYKSYNISLLEKNDVILEKIINNIKPLGGTNTGEGLRKAIYMLDNGDKNASKTIVLMSDGKPTYYSTYSNKSFYKEIDNEYTSVAGTGSSTNKETREYSNFIAKIINTRGYNSYSIGYGITDGKDDFMKIHASMRGLASEKEVNQENGFFEKSEGSITEIFNQIAENIKEGYDLKEVSLEIEFNQGFKLNIEGNEVNIGNIIYKKVSEKGGRIIYRAEAVNFNFIVKASQIGENQSIFRNLYIKYPWNETKERINIQSDLKVGIIANELPTILPELLTEKTILAKKNSEIKFEYEITPQDFYYNNAFNSGEKDVVVIFERAISDGNTFTNIKNSLIDRLINPLQNEGKTKFSFITFYNKGAKVDISFENYGEYGTTNTYYEKVREYVQSSINNGDNNEITASNAKDIYNGLELAIDELSKNSRATANKNIIIIANNDINYNKKNNNDEAIKKIKSLGYNVITLSLGNEMKDSNLYKLHDFLGGESTSIFNTNNNSNNINTDSCMGAIREKLISYSIPKPYEFNPEIKLNLGSNFTAIKGIDASGIIKIPTITYNLTQNNNYSAKSQFVEVTLKVNNLPSGEYGFGVKSDNTMTYSSLLGESVVVNLETPIVKIKDDVKGLVHGLYEGIENNEINIYSPLEGNETIISPGATVTFGAKFITSNDDFELTLDGDSKFNKMETSDIKVYKLDKTNNSLVEITNPKDETTEKKLEIEDLGDNKFIIKASNLNNNSEDTEIVIIYKGRIGDKIENESFTNSVKISDLNADIKIKTGSSSNSNNEEDEEDYQGVLPDLF